MVKILLLLQEYYFTVIATFLYCIAFIVLLSGFGYCAGLQPKCDARVAAGVRKYCNTFQSINTSISIFHFRFLASSILLPMDLEPTFYTMTIRQHLQNCNENWSPRSSGNSLQVLKKTYRKDSKGLCFTVFKNKNNYFLKIPGEMIFSRSPFSSMMFSM